MITQAVRFDYQATSQYKRLARLTQAGEQVNQSHTAFYVVYLELKNGLSILSKRRQATEKQQTALRTAQEKLNTVYQNVDNSKRYLDTLALPLIQRSRNECTSQLERDISDYLARVSEYLQQVAQHKITQQNAFTATQRLYKE